MKKIALNDPEFISTDILAENVQHLKARNIAELTKERLRRAGQKIRAELEAAQEQNPKTRQQPLFADSASSRAPSSLDLGFRVFKLDTSNIRPWSPDRDNLEMSLLDYVEHIKDDRSEADVLYELLLKLGLDLCVPMEQKVFAGKTVHSIGGGVLLVCLDKNIASEDLEELAQGIVEWHKALAPVAMTTCVFRDNGFADDVVKTNLAAILNQHGLVNVRSL